MASVQEQLVAALANVAGGRIYAAIARDAPETPFVVYSRTSAVHEMTLAGRSMTNTHFQIDCYDDSYSAVVAVRDSVLAALDAWAARPVLLSESDLFEDDTRLFRISIDVSVWV
jgi:hypothetical protein